MDCSGHGEPARPPDLTGGTVAGRSQPIFARVYERLSVVMDRAGAAEHRRALVAGLSGRVIEVGAAGFVVDELARFRFPATGPGSPAAPHIRGVARRPIEDHP